MQEATTSWSFDMVEFDRVTDGHALSCLASFLFEVTALALMPGLHSGCHDGMLMSLPGCSMLSCCCIAQWCRQYFPSHVVLMCQLCCSNTTWCR